MYKFFAMFLLILILLFTCTGCALFVAKETAKVVEIVLEEEPNPDKKKKILKNKNEKIKSQNERAKEFYCSKVKNTEKCKDE
tara:strand:- start:175 stop:420 length:246 start_codon:yes stop_codon:yes gene_type:complete